MVLLAVNGTKTELDIDPATPLVLALRNDLNLRGVRASCALGQCGACVVLADGDPIRSCQTPVAAVADAEITTPEGLGTPSTPHPVQQAFLEEQAGQCGYCGNGMIMSIAALLARDPAPDQETIKDCLGGHLCRCGTHPRVLRAACRLAGHQVPPPPEPVRQPQPATAPAEPSDPDPAALATAPLVEHWLQPLPDGRVAALSGRVEIGQGVRTALAQVVAAELEIPMAQVEVRSAATDASPDEGYTAGSMSLEQGGRALARAAAAYRRLRDSGLPPTGPITAADQPRWTGGPIGSPAPRTDLRHKLTGAPAFVHDLALPGMVHARALLPPTYDARPAHLELDAARARPGVLAVVADGGLVLVIAEREEQARWTVEQLAATARWDDPGLPEDGDLRDRPATPYPVVSDPGTAEALAAGRQVTASYAKPYESHGSYAPSAAVAQLDHAGQLTVWTHSQGVFPFRRELATLLQLDEDRLTVRHADGPGCYGHNGADDAAAFAALAAQAVPGRPVRFQYTVRDEFGWEPYAPPMSADLVAALGPDGRITGWQHRIHSGAHLSRPNGDGDRLVAAWLRAGGPPRPWTGASHGGVRNAEPIYDLPARDIHAGYVRTALRTSSLRGLGAYFNLFAIESFMDELAVAAETDPLAFRLAHLRDERARAVLELAAERAGWRPRVGASGAGQGLALGRYHHKAYIAQVVTVDPDRHRVRRVVTVCDAGTVINPDGLRNQLDGGTLQGLSRAQHERVRVDRHGIHSRDWDGYPVLGFADVPDLDTVLLDRPGLPPLGAGEVTTPVTPAALANARFDASGHRHRELPLPPPT